jgi:hypothetical protein
MGELVILETCNVENLDDDVLSRDGNVLVSVVGGAMAGLRFNGLGLIELFVIYVLVLYITGLLGGSLDCIEAR